MLSLLLKNLKNKLIFTCMLLISSHSAFSFECVLNNDWSFVCKNLSAKYPKSTKLNEDQIAELQEFINQNKDNFPQLQKLKFVMPKTVTELLISIKYRDIPESEAENIATYLGNIVASCRFKNLNAFDKNNSHLIGREWDEIDYTGENMTSDSQKEKYKNVGVSNFKTLENFKKFFPYESKLKYFKKYYQSDKCIF